MTKLLLHLPTGTRFKLRNQNIMNSVSTRICKTAEISCLDIPCIKCPFNDGTNRSCTNTYIGIEQFEVIDGIS